MAEKRPALGRGLHALIPPAPIVHGTGAAPAGSTTPAAAPAGSGPPATTDTALSSGAARDARPSELDIDLLSPNPNQPRAEWDDARLDELAQSIRTHGVIQPILVRRAGDRFEIVAGERRWRAAQRAGLLKVPVNYRDVPDDKMLEVALIENIQREDLNPIEEAQAYRRLTDEFHLSQEQIAAQVGKDRATVANYMRLLKLPVEVRNDVATGAVSMGHARALVSLADEQAQRRIAREIVSTGFPFAKPKGSSAAKNQRRSRPCRAESIPTPARPKIA